jgi:single-stranded-DNA-specific exonuclease
LLLTENAARARAIAHALDAQNRERRAVENDVLLAAEAQLAEWFQPGRDAAIVVGAQGWHSGVVGIVASRVMRRHHRPTLVIGFDESGTGKGSGRSIAGLSLVEALGHCAPLLEKFGGHEMAAGMTLPFARFAEFRDAFRIAARALLTDEQLTPRLHLDAELSLAEIGLPLLEQHATLQPFGMGNPEPVFVARGVELAGEPRVLKEKHLSFVLRQRGARARAIWFNSTAHELPGTPWDVAFTVERNEYQGVVSPQMHVKAVRAAG